VCKTVGFWKVTFGRPDPARTDPLPNPAVYGIKAAPLRSAAAGLPRRALLWEARPAHAGPRVRKALQIKAAQRAGRPVPRAAGLPSSRAAAGGDALRVWRAVSSGLGAAPGLWTRVGTRAIVLGVAAI
jgi:hypothetical protein